MNDDGTLVRLEGIHKWFDTLHVLRGIDLKIVPQEVAPAARLTPAVGAPAPSIAVTNRAPPTQRALNSFAAAELKSNSSPWSSAHTKAPA